MPGIPKLSERYSLDAAELADRGVFTVDDLWACIGKDVDKGLAQVATNTAIDDDVLLAFLIVDALEDPRRSYRPRPLALWLGLRPLWQLLQRFANSLRGWGRNRKAIWSKVKEHRFGFDLFWLIPKWLHGRSQTAWGTRGNLWPDLVLIGLPLLIVGLGIRAQLLNRRVVQRVAVKPGVTLPAFALIDTQKLITRPVMNEPGTFASIDDLNQRYPLTDLASGELIKDQQLLQADISWRLKGRQLLSVPIKTGGVPITAQPIDHASRVKLMLVPREKEKAGLVIDDVMLLATKREGETTLAVVAISDQAVASMQSLIGLSDIFLLQTLQ